MDLQKYFDTVLLFIYSDRKGTPASSLPGKIKHADLKERMRMIEGWLCRCPNMRSGHEKDYIDSRFGDLS
jgi:tRNA A37 methylthiotransferase MiaB